MALPQGMSLMQMKALKPPQVKEETARESIPAPQPHPGGIGGGNVLPQYNVPPPVKYEGQQQHPTPYIEQPHSGISMPPHSAPHYPTGNYQHQTMQYPQGGVRGGGVHMHGGMIPASAPGQIVSGGIHPAHYSVGAPRHGDNHQHPVQLQSDRHAPQSLQDMLSSMDPTCRLSEDVELLLLQIADDFVERVCIESCQLAEYRGSQTMETKDVLLCLAKSWDITFEEGGANAEARSAETNRQTISKRRMEMKLELMDSQNRRKRQATSTQK